jgi:hypothetical protein
MELRSMYVNRHNNTTVGPQQYNRFTIDGHKLYPDIMWPFIALINGTIRAWPHLDRPWLDLHTEPNPDYHCNEQWLKHNNRWLLLFALWQ